MNDCIEAEIQFIEAVKQGLSERDSGALVGHDVVMAEYSARRERNVGAGLKPARSRTIKL